jgi:hypothetical protein
MWDISCCPTFAWRQRETYQIFFSVNIIYFFSVNLTYFCAGTDQLHHLPDTFRPESFTFIFHPSRVASPTGPTQLNALQRRPYTRYVILLCCVMKSRHVWDNYWLSVWDISSQRGTFDMSPSISGNIYILPTILVLACLRQRAPPVLHLCYTCATPAWPVGDSQKLICWWSSGDQRWTFFRFSSAGMHTFTSCTFFHFSA